MKLTITAIFIACLQLALAPVCLCGGMNTAEEVPSCCHSEKSSHSHPGKEDCPHCNGEDDIQVSIPVQNGFTPELTVIELPSFESNEIRISPRSMENLAETALVSVSPPTFEHLNRAVLGVFVV